MSERLRHRGPEGSGSWLGGSAAVGRRLLNPAPESPGPAPVAEDSGRFVLVADARIDNRDELIAMLGLPMSSDPGLTDEEIILQAHRAWGRAAPEKLIGDFAYALWDVERRSFFCARDPMGVKPFYYHLSDRLFAFASEMKGLFCFPEIPREVDEVQVAFFLDRFLDDDERTFFRSVQRLPAAAWLEVSEGRVQTGRHWTPDPKREIRYSSSEQYVEEFRDLFARAVECRLRTPHPLGSALSGGLDSSSIVCVARELLGKDRPLPVVSAVFPGLPEPDLERNDESRYIDAVTALEGIESYRVRADEINVFEYLDRIFWHHDAPPFAYMLWMRWAVYEAAAARGIRVFLTGDDGDSVVSHGYERFYDMTRGGEWRVMAAEVEALAGRMNASPKALIDLYVMPHLATLARTGNWRSWNDASREISRSFQISRSGVVRHTAMDAFVPDRLIEGYRRIRRRRKRPLLRPEFARRVGLEERERALRPEIPRGFIPPGREQHVESLPSPLLQYMLELTDSTGSAFSIETRYPFLDRRLIDFTLAVPSEQKLADGWTRLILRRAMEGIVPPEIQWRVRKSDLAYNFVRRLRGDDRDDLFQALFEEPAVLAEYIDMDELRSIHQRFDSGSRHGARHASGTLYFAAVLARWFRANPPN